MESSLLPLPADPRWRRLFGLVLFLVLIYALRELAPVFICVVLLVRTMSASADFLEHRVRIGHRGAIASLLSGIVAALGVVLAIAVHRALPYVRAMRTDWREYVETFTHNPAVERMRQYATQEGNEGVTDTVKHYAVDAMKYATAFAHVTLFLLIGFILSVIYLFEREEIDGFFHGLRPHSVVGTLCRWGGYVADAIVVTARMQVITAIVNALITLPVLIAIRMPHTILLFFLILLTGLLPVVGNLIAGAVLCAVAFESRGLWAVGVLLVVTIILHKIESYYLTPRLAAQHVKLPGLVLVISLLVFENAFGFAGLFLSFPTLYVAMRIKNEWRADQAVDVLPSGAVVTESGSIEP